MYDFIIKNANLFGSGHFFEEGIDIAIKDGKTANWKRDMHHSLADKYFDAKNMLVTPALINTHSELDKSYITSDAYITDYESAEKEFSACINKRYENLSKDEIKKDVYDRSKKALDENIENGVLHIRNFASVDEVYGDIAFEVSKELQKEYAEKANVQLGFYYKKEYKDYCDKILESGDFDVIGAVIKDTDDAKEIVDTLIEFARKYQKAICFDFKGTDKKSFETLGYICDETMKYQLQHTVTCSHLLFLRDGGIQQFELDTMAARIVRARINVETMVSTDLNLGDWKTRGITIVNSLVQQGVSVSFAVDNIKNVFSPLGSAKMLRELLLAAQLLKLSTNSQMSQLYDLVSFTAAGAMLYMDYGVDPEFMGDYVVFDKAILREAIMNPCEIKAIIKNGKII